MSEPQNQHATSEKMGLNATWAMAVGGMVGGGIFSVLGVIIELAGAWAWASFVISGLIALATGYSYVQLANSFGEGGGAYLYLRKMAHPRFAGTLAIFLILGYVLTISVYAFTFGHYLGAVLDFGPMFEHGMALGIVAVLAGINLRGVGQASSTEEMTVWVKVVLLVALAIAGLMQFSPSALQYDRVEIGGWMGVLIGSASIFMAYEGFQLLAYDYEDIREPKKTMARAIYLSIPVVILIYVIVSLGAASLVGAATIVQHKEIALAMAGQQWLGAPGKWLMSLAAVFSTASAINATLFATARLARRVANDDEIPKVFRHENPDGIPDRAILLLAAGGGVLAVIGSLTRLVEAASLTFLFTFGVVNWLAFQHHCSRRWVSFAGGLFSSLACLTLAVRLMMESPWLVGGLAVLVASVVWWRSRTSRETAA